MMARNTFALGLSTFLLSLRCFYAEEICEATCTGSGASRECLFRFKIDIFAGDTGYYRVEGCNGVQPTLKMEAGVKYTFDQEDETNWFHPLGFAYGPDGVYGDNPELEVFVDGDGNPCKNITTDEDIPCEDLGKVTQFPQYKMNGDPLCDNGLPCNAAVDGDFGLDQYEGVHFSGGRADWIEGLFQIELTINDPDTKEIFYFCHIHNQMSGRIKIFDTDTNTFRSEKNIVPIPYSFDKPDSFDKKCGVFNVSQYRNKCQEKTFLCGDDSDNDFGQCMNAIDCAMHEEMRVNLDQDPTTVFMHQMIAHHRNAVNMAKVLLKLNPYSLSCGTNYDGRRLEGRSLQSAGRSLALTSCGDTDNADGGATENLLWEIINAQNAQITYMKSWLVDNNQPSHGTCNEEPLIGYIIGLSVLGFAFLLASAAAVIFFRRWKKSTPVNASATVEEKL